MNEKKYKSAEEFQSVAEIAEMPIGDEGNGFSIVFCQQTMEIGTRIHIISLRFCVAPLVAGKRSKP